MNYRYGFELEGFYRLSDNTIVPPPAGYPLDGFPGLIELRTYGHHPLEEACSKIIGEMSKLDVCHLDFRTCEHTFTPAQKRELRKKNAYKETADIQNIYKKQPRALGNKTIASLQINISNLTRPKYTEYKNDKEVSHSDRFSLLDIPRIVLELDSEFFEEIKDSGRQRGEYSVKGDRLEYRSLPNFVFPTSYKDIPEFLKRIRKAVE